MVTVLNLNKLLRKVGKVILPSVNLPTSLYTEMFVSKEDSVNEMVIIRNA